MTSKSEPGTSSSPCPVCGVGEVSFNISKFFSATVATYEQIDKRGKKRSRARLEIRSAMVDDFLSKFSAKDSVAIFVVPLDKLKRGVSDKDLEDLDNGKEA